MNYQLITQQDELVSALAQLAPVPLMIDTEFVRVRSYYPHLGLFQIFDGQTLLLIDPLGLDLTPLWERLFTNTSVLHAASEDLELIAHLAGRLPDCIEDTQIAASFLGHGNSIGFAALVEHYLQVSLSKDQARTDWLARPLTAKQLEYAAFDVFYLYPLHQALMAKLADSPKKAWFEEECQRLCAKKLQSLNPELAYLDCLNAWQLNPEQLAILRELTKWRLNEAKRRDMALNFVVKEPHLVAVATAKPRSLRELNELGLLPMEIKYHGQKLLDLVEAARNSDPSSWPQRVTRLVDHAGYKSELKRLKGIVERVAQEHDLPAELIASKRIIHQYLSWMWNLTEAEQQESQPLLCTGWRAEILGDLTK